MTAAIIDFAAERERRTPPATAPEGSPDAWQPAEADAIALLLFEACRLIREGEWKPAYKALTGIDHRVLDLASNHSPAERERRMERKRRQIEAANRAAETRRRHKEERAQRQASELPPT